MKRVTNSTFGMLMANRKKDTVTVQMMTKAGKWGKPFEATRYGKETDEQVAARLEILNNRECRLAQ